MVFLIPSKKLLLLGGFLIIVLLTSYGCGGDAETVTVDFSKTIVIERPSSRIPASDLLNVAVAAMISPKETLIYYQQILDYIGSRLGRDVHLVQRKTYGEVNDLIGKGQIDLAFICSGPYANDKQEYGFEALVTPLVRGEPFYQSYLIVNTNSPDRNLKDLRGRTFAFTDPDSNSGALVPKFWLSQLGETPDSFFGKTIYTHSHDNSILAVARSLVDAAAVDGHKWEYYNHRDPIHTSKTRVIKKSQPFGSPPLVASAFLPKNQKQRIREVLYAMHLNPAGKKILEELMINRFVSPQDRWYEPIRLMQRQLGRLETASYADEKP